MRTCSHPGCERKHFGKGWCQVHYARVRKYGDPNFRMKNRGTGTTIENFWSRVDKTGSCWEWVGRKYRNGYGQAWSQEEKAQKLAHRLSWEIENGSIPAGMQVDHMCHNPACVKPSHLRVVTPKQNMENLGRIRSDNTTGFRGVRLEKRTGRYYARVFHLGKEYSAGTHATAGAANEAVVALRNKLFTHNDLDRLGDLATGTRRAA